MKTAIRLAPPALLIPLLALLGILAVAITIAATRHGAASHASAIFYRG